MSTIKEHINRISSKLQQLLKDYKQLKEENSTLRKNIAEQKSKQQQQVTLIEELQQQVIILKAATGNMKEADKKEFEKKINQYIKHIDKSINLLSE